MKAIVPILVLGLAAVLIAFLFHEFPGVPYKSDIVSEATDLVGALVVVAVFLERSLSVVNSIWYGEERREGEVQVQAAGQDLAWHRDLAVRAEANLDLLRQEGTAAGAVAPPRSARAWDETVAARDTRVQAVGTSLSTLSNARKALAQTEAKETRVRVAFGFIFALLVSAAGVRTLEALLDVAGATGLRSAQLGVFHGIDIVLTAGLLAGGSNGIHAIADVIGKYTKKASHDALASMRRL